jgi:hypothetical protein
MWEIPSNNDAEEMEIIRLYGEVHGLSCGHAKLKPCRVDFV